MCFGGSKPAEDTYVQDKQAALMQQMEADWASRFKPIEEELIGELMNRDQAIRRNVYEAGEAAQDSYQATQDMAERNMARYGTQMDADQKAAQERSDAMASKGAIISARNMAREGTTARYEGMQKNMTSMGRGVQMQGIQGLNSAAGMEANRNQQNSQIYAQNQAAGWQTLGAAAGMAGMVMMSDKDTKKNVRKASPKKALKDVKAVELKHFDYKPGMSGGRPEQGHIGGMAQDMPDSMTTGDKRHVDLGDSVMTLIGATQELSKKVDRMEKRHGRG
ncbi:MAG: hypothetical protein JAY71_18805 [Candidatus Thiodiazotropha weberae]|nr:hypothetical protein [Candidatus Thiodiazotropha weberae]